MRLIREPINSKHYYCLKVDAIIVYRLMIIEVAGYVVRGTNSSWSVMKLKSFNSVHKKEAALMLLEGGRPQDIAANFGVHASTIYALRKDMGHGHTKADRATHVVRLRLSVEEFEALAAFVSDAGFKNRTAAVRSLIRAATGFLELKRSDFDELSEIRRELKAQGNNLNQIAFALNKSARKGGAKLSREEQGFLAELRRAYVSVDALVSNAIREVRQKGRDALHTSDRL